MRFGNRENGPYECSRYTGLQFGSARKAGLSLSKRIEPFRVSRATTAAGTALDAPLRRIDRQRGNTTPRQEPGGGDDESNRDSPGNLGGAAAQVEQQADLPSKEIQMRPGTGELSSNEAAAYLAMNVVAMRARLQRLGVRPRVGKTARGATKHFWPMAAIEALREAREALERARRVAEELQ